MTQVSIRDVDVELFREFKAKAVREGLNVGKALNMAISQWLMQNKDRKSFLNLKPVNLGKGTENLGRDVDKILYGKI